MMIALLELIAVGVLLLLGAQLLFGFRLFGARERLEVPRAPADLSPARHAAEHLRELSNAQADLKARYPILFSMLGGYLNAHSINEAGGIEAAARSMVADWARRREEAKAEIVKVLAENPSEEEVRAIILAAADADFETEGYRNWLIWLLGRFNAS
jgi:hypothetical protein